MHQTSLRPNGCKKSYSSHILSDAQLTDVTVHFLVVDALPEETIADIFLHCLPIEDGRSASLDPKDAPVSLTHVCRRWREIAVNYGRLGSSLRFKPHSGFVKGNPHLVFELASSALERCKRSKHLVELHFAGQFHRLSRDSCRILLKPFLVLNTSLTTLALKSVPLGEIIELPRGLFPALESLALSFSRHLLNMQVWGMRGQLIRAFEDLPNLRRSAFNSRIFTKPIDVQLSLTWSQITHFLYMTNDPSVRPLLKDRLAPATQLRYLSLEIGADDVAGSDLDLINDGPLAIQYDNLEWLTINLWGSRNYVRYPLVLEYAAFPNLKTLRLDGPEWDFDKHRSWWPPALKERFIAKLKSFTHLECFSLCVQGSSRTTFERIFRAIPGVTTLELHIFYNYEFVFETLTHQEDPTQSPLPHLSTLIIEAGHCEAHDIIADEDSDYEDGLQPINAEVFEEFLESRTQCPEEFRLRKVVVYGTYEADLDETTVNFIWCLNGFRSRGLEVDLRVVKDEAKREVRINTDNLWLDRDPLFEERREARIVE